MTTIQLASDLHLEKNTNIPFSELIKPSAPILCLCGDIGYCQKSLYQEFIQWCSTQFEQVFVIAGNHEYYETDLTFEQMNDLIESICKRHINVHYLNNRSVVHDEYCIIGTTLWYYTPANKRSMVRNFFTGDFGMIYKNKPMTIDMMNSIFTDNVNFLIDEIAKHPNKKIIILSHHLASKTLIHPKYLYDPLESTGFYTDLEFIINSNPNILLWLGGHTHTSMNSKVNNCLMHVNPKGVGDENTYYNNGYVLTV